MFTGIITDLGTIQSIDKAGDWKIRIQSERDLSPVPIGASIACSGVCLTVVEKDKHSFLVQVSQETLNKTAIGAWTEGSKINLEFSLKMGDELGGHLVFGHVDGLGEVISITPIGDSRHIVIRLPNDLKHLAAVKGSIALDGISLTVNAVNDNQIDLMIIPHTWAVTSWGNLKVGQKIHVEADMLARYAARKDPEIEFIKQRNARVEQDKAWETSLIRRGMIAGITYLTAAVILYALGSNDWYAGALIPVAGYMLSTLTLPFIKKRYISTLLDCQEK
jgi:riboflavin synthase